MRKCVESCDFFYKALGHGVRVVRLRKGISQQELADSVRLTRTSVCNIEAGRQRILAHQIADFAFALGVSAQSLLRDGLAGYKGGTL